MSAECTQFIAGGGRKGNQCTTCRQKQHRHPTPSDGNPPVTTNLVSTQQHAASCPPPPENPVQDILDRYTRSHSQPRIITPQLELVRHEVVSGLRKMPPRAAKVKTLTRGFMPVNAMTRTSTSSRVQVERTVKIGMLFMTPRGLGQVSVQYILRVCI